MIKKLLVILLLISGCGYRSDDKVMLSQLRVKNLETVYQVGDHLNIDQIEVVDDDGKSYDFIIKEGDMYQIEDGELIFDQKADPLEVLFKVLNTSTEELLSFSINVKEKDKNSFEYSRLEDEGLILVNKEYQLHKDYEPYDLVVTDGGVEMLRTDANEAFMALKEEMMSRGLMIYVISGYRSYETQKNLYDNYKDQHGQEEADSFSARPGHSEHQTGLAVDVADASGNFLEFGNTEEFEYVKGNAHRFGFIVRYTEANQEITGYVGEPWHLRYVGVFAATEIYEGSIDSLETYLEGIK